MWNRLLICGVALGVATSALAESPADALQPANRSEVALLMERLAALEQRTAEREAKLQNHIDRLEKRLRQLEYQQPIHRVAADPRPNRNPSPPISRWHVQWLETGVRWLPNGDFAWNPSESLGTLEPQPHEIHGRWSIYSDQFFLGPIGSDIARYWIVPPLTPNTWSDPLDHGLLIGTEKYRNLPAKRSYFEMLDDLLSTYRSRLLYW